MNKYLIKKIHEIHVKQLKYLNVPNKKLVICFSGIAGSGKTYIAKILEKKYKGVRVSSNEVRKILTEIDKDTDKDYTTYNYLDWFFDNYDFENNLIILDQGIDRRYEHLFSMFGKEGFEIFIIRLETSRKTYERRIIKKIGRLDDNYLSRGDDWRRQFKEFGEKVKADIIIENEKDNELDLEPLFRKLDKLVK